ncbi:hypothetical protein HNQ51_000008 [Inhella inkyongensis]|uniref:Uncharacterized protein n=1 Tax=Inhella inkyongensis TaxID=392593 RepID=A0A840RXR5_9BURK|nr:hypothetical protein [Inhella inkyongensis]MBB5202715.1 hypothetical protein [Inhella inkyongensis]
MKNPLWMCAAVLALPVQAHEMELQLRPLVAEMAQLQQQVEREVQAAMEGFKLMQHRVIELEGLGHLGSLGHLGQEKVVKGAPYCADAVHESIQPLADGNRIVKRQSTRLCRDGEGRTRREVQRGDSKLVYLNDPVAKEAWVLDPERKSARQLFSAKRWHFGHAGEWSDWGREMAQRMREHFKDLPEPPKAPAAPTAPAAPKAPGEGEPAVVIETDVLIKQGEGEPKRNQERRVYKLSDLKNLPAMPPMPPLPALPEFGFAPQWQQFAPRGEAVQTALPAKEIEGLKVNGERSTWTIAAGKIGNEKPIVITREVWTSPELMLTVHSRDFDPRSGETVYRLEKLKRGEPDAALMKPPADYSRRSSLPTPRTPGTPKAPASAPTALKA